jgi:hypothetical protein
VCDHCRRIAALAYAVNNNAAILHSELDTLRQELAELRVRLDVTQSYIRELRKDESGD